MLTNHLPLRLKNLENTFFAFNNVVKLETFNNVVKSDNIVHFVVVFEYMLGPEYFLLPDYTQNPQFYN